MRNTLFASAALAALLAATPAFAQAPVAASPGAAMPAMTDAVRRMMEAENTLQSAFGAMTNATGAAGTAAMGTVRQAVEGLSTALGGMTAEHRGMPGHQTLARELTQAREALMSNDATRVRTEVGQVLAASRAARAEMGMGSANVVTTQVQSGAQGVAGTAVTGPQLEVRQAPAQVQVQQGVPEILVVIPQPEIIVRQPPAQVTVRMPEPTVNVQQAPPQVAVQQAPPQVAVAQVPAQVAVGRAEPRVEVRQAEGQPTVRFEQAGQPVIRTEQVGSAAPGQPVAAPVAGAATATAVASSATQLQGVIGRNLVGANGRDAGRVENLVVDATGNVRGVVVEWGGFLGLGERRAVVPVDQVTFGAGNESARLNMTREQLERLGEFRSTELGATATRLGWGEGTRLFR